MTTGEQRYTQSIERAYQELMSVYQEEVRVQQLLNKQFNERQLLLDKARLGVGRKSGGGAGFDNLDVFKYLLDAQKEINDVSIHNGKMQVQAEDTVNQKYEPSDQAKLDMATLVNESIPGGRGSSLFTSTGVKDNLIRTLSTQTKEQKQSLFYQYGQQLLNKNPGNPNLLGELQSLLEIPQGDNLQKFEARKAIEIATTANALQTDSNQTRELQQSVSKLNAQLQAPAQRVSATATSQEGAQKLPELKAPELKTIKPPTGQEVLAKAADYYSPFGTKDFNARKAFMEEMTPPPPKQIAKEMIPEPMKPLVPVMTMARDIEDMSYEELLNKGTGYAYGAQMVKQDKMKVPEMIKNINENRNLSDLERQESLAVIAANHHKNWKQRNRQELK